MMPGPKANGFDLPFIKLWVNDFIADTYHWTDEEVGAYFRLLLHQWRYGEIPSDHQRRQRICDSLPRTWETIRHKFPETNDGRFQNCRLERERESAAMEKHKRVKQTEAARLARQKTVTDTVTEGVTSIPLIAHSSDSQKIRGSKPIKRKQRSAADKISDTDILAVFERHLKARRKYFERKNGRKPSSLPDLTPELRRKIREAIQRHGLEKATKAGVGIFYSEFHTGTNDTGREFLSPELCWRIQGGKTRDTNNVERFAELAIEKEALYVG